MTRRVLVAVACLSVTVAAEPPAPRACAFERAGDLRTVKASSGPVPEAWRAAVGRAASWGPRWRTPSGDWAAAISWDGGAHATIALAHGAADGGVTFEQGELQAGWSARYQEGFAPELLGAPVVLRGRPLPLVQHEEMGGGGGGGPLVSIIVPAGDGGVREQPLGAVEMFTNINFVAAAQDRCRGGLFASRDGTALRLERCFDDAPTTPLCFVWSPDAGDYRLVPSAPRRQ